jgi:dCMP deaminase
VSNISIRLSNHLVFIPSLAARWYKNTIFAGVFTGNPHSKKGCMKKYDPVRPYGEKQEQFDRRYLEMAVIWSRNSYCKRRQVGALIVKEKMIISDGYNGTPSGFENVCEDEDNKTKPYVLHAEANAITKVAKSNNSSDGATLYITSGPCLECAKLIIQSGIRRVVFCDKYRMEDGVTLLKKANIEVVYLELEKQNGI